MAPSLPSIQPPEQPSRIDNGVSSPRIAHDWYRVVTSGLKTPHTKPGPESYHSSTSGQGHTIPSLVDDIELKADGVLANVAWPPRGCTVTRYGHYMDAEDPKMIHHKGRRRCILRILTVAFFLTANGYRIQAHQEAKVVAAILMYCTIVLSDSDVL